MGRDTFHNPRLLQSLPSMALNNSRDGTAKASLRIQFQGLTTFKWKNLFPISHLSVWSHSGGISHQWSWAIQEQFKDSEGSIQLRGKEIRPSEIPAVEGSMEKICSETSDLLPSFFFSWISSLGQARWGSSFHYSGQSFDQTVQVLGSVFPQFFLHI